MFLQNFIDEQRRLLILEKSEEINQSKIISESPPKILEEKNLCIRKLHIANIFTGLYGRTIVEFEATEKREASSKRVFSAGDIVAVCKDSAKNDITKPLATGLFYKLTKDCIEIALDNESEGDIIREVEGERLRLVKLSSEVTYQRIKAGLKYLEKRSNPLCGDHLIDLLMGNTQLRSPDPKRDISFFNKSLNDSQKEAVSFALSRPDIAIIHGPPGTGKTTVTVEIIAQIIDNFKNTLNKSPKILVCTPSNIALDNLAEKLVKVFTDGKVDKNNKTIKKSINVLRIGHSARVMSHLSDLSLDHKLSVCDQAELISQVRSQIDWTLKQSFNRNGKRLDKRRELSDLRKELRERELKAVREVLNSSQVIMSTLTGLRSNKSLPLNEIEFDVVVIDEVSQAIEAACWLAIPRGKKLIIAGDHKQLPPTVLSEEAAKAGLSRSLMERLLDLFPRVETTRMLTCQYRMHEKIMQWSSDTFYQSDLIADVSVAKHLLSDICTDCDSDLGPIEPLVFIDTAGCDLFELESSQEDSKGNIGESHLAAVYIKYIVERFHLTPDQIGVITPYSRQVQIIKECLREKVEFSSEFDFSQIEISTVDGFQGREKEIIVTTLVRSNPTGTVGFLAESRRLNVALTRAKRHLCVIGDSSTLERSKDVILCSLVTYWNSEAEVRSAHEYIYDNDINSGDCVKPKPNQNLKTNQKLKNINDTNESKELEKKLCDKIKKFKENQSETLLEFPADITPRLRAMLHELCEQLQLNHVSVGEGTSRKLIVSKPLVQATDISNERVNLETELLETVVENKKPNPIIVTVDSPINIENGKNIEEIYTISSQILREKSDRLKKNLEERKEAEIKEKINKPIKIKKKKEKKIESAVLEEISEDFDTMIEQFERMNKICQNPKKCSTPVAVLGFDCNFCKRRFCSSHSLPEVHSCGRADRSAWIANDPGQRPCSSKKQELRHNQLSRAMARKIGEMAAERTGSLNQKK